MDLREIVAITVLNRRVLFWHKEGTVEEVTAAAEAMRDRGEDAIIDTIEREIKKREFICNFDDPCDEWPPYLDNPEIRGWMPTAA